MKGHKKPLIHPYMTRQELIAVYQTTNKTFQAITDKLGIPKRKRLWPLEVMEIITYLGDPREFD
ncbi:MAG: hypothetical protein AAF843_17070 [Bacteroidota bacterium]